MKAIDFVSLHSFIDNREKLFLKFEYCYLMISGQKFAMNEEKVMLSAIFRNFHVKSCQKESELMPVGELVLRPEKGIWVELSAR